MSDDPKAQLQQAHERIAELERRLETEQSSPKGLREHAGWLFALEGTGVGILEWDIEAGTLEVSEHWPILTGYPGESLPPLPDFLRMVVHSDDLPKALKATEELLVDGCAPQAVEYRLKHKQGHWYWVAARCVVSDRDEDGNAKRVVGTLTDITERRRAAEALRESESRFRVLADGAPVVLFVNDPNGGVQFVNRTYCEYFGITPDQAEGGKWRPLVHPEDSERYLKRFLAAVAERESFRSELRVRRGDGEWRAAEAIAEPRHAASGEYLGHVGIIVDLTERKRAEEERSLLQSELLHAKKLESVGRLAGGVAHDFNNMLAVILGSVELCLRYTESEHVRSGLLGVRAAAQRSAELTRQLLAYARKQPTVPRPLDVNEQLDAMLPILSRLIGENISLGWEPAPALWRVMMDSVQLDQVITNLCVNARDSIDSSGSIRIIASNHSLDEERCSTHPGIEPGDFVRIAVSDDGCGMGEEELELLFEPFYTTKGRGTGTGLGLATVYGIIQQNKGFIEVTSAVDQGTTLEIFLPRLSQAAEAAEAAEEPEADEPEADEPEAASRPRDSAASGETILVVEDELPLLETVAKILEGRGYRVLAAAAPTEALKLAEEHGESIDLLLTDVIMPELDGRELSRRLLSLVPGLKVLFMSGYTADIIAEHGVLDPEVMFIEKPFSVTKLAAKVRDALQHEPDRSE